jgi:hypothetical protein
LWDLYLAGNTIGGGKNTYTHTNHTKHWRRENWLSCF